MNVLFIPLAIVIALAWARLIRPGANTVIGATILVAPLPLLARLRMHAFPSIVVLALTAAIEIGGGAPLWFVVFPLASITAMMLIPVRYTLTPVGIRLGWTSFRRWTEFSGVRRAPGGARLIGLQRLGGMTIWLSGSRGDDEFLHFLRQTIKSAYKGTPTVGAIPGERPTPTTDAPGSHGHRVAAFTSDVD